MWRRFPGLASLVATAAFAIPVGAVEAPPTPTQWVTDNAGFLSATSRSSLDTQLQDYEQRSGHQVLVWIGRTAGGEPIEDFAVRAFKAWRVGRKGIDDGIVLFLLTEDRRVRIEVGYGLEGQVPDAIASRIVREVIEPRLRSGDPDGAMREGFQAIVAAIEGNSSPTSGARGPYRGGSRGHRQLSSFEMVVLGVVGLVFLVLLVTHPSLAVYLLFNVLSEGGGSGYSPGGGGFSGGGGRSGGGGASGSW